METIPPSPVPPLNQSLPEVPPPPAGAKPAAPEVPVTESLQAPTPVAGAASTPPESSPVAPSAAIPVTSDVIAALSAVTNAAAPAALGTPVAPPATQDQAPPSVAPAPEVKEEKKEIVGDAKVERLPLEVRPLLADKEFSLTIADHIFTFSPAGKKLSVSVKRVDGKDVLSEAKKSYAFLMHRGIGFAQVKDNEGIERWNLVTFIPVDCTVSYAEEGAEKVVEIKKDRLWDEQKRLLEHVREQSKNVDPLKRDWVKADASQKESYFLDASDNCYRFALMRNPKGEVHEVFHRFNSDECTWERIDKLPDGVKIPKGYEQTVAKK